MNVLVVYRGIEKQNNIFDLEFVEIAGIVYTSQQEEECSFLKGLYKAFFIDSPDLYCVSLNEIDIVLYFDESIVYSNPKFFCRYQKILCYFYGNYGEYTYNICSFENKINSFTKCDSYNILVTGISYAETSIDQNQFSRKIFNFGKSSQDLFYDYEILKYIFDNYRNITQNIGYCFLFLAAYSLNYDLSLSKYKEKTLRYYRIINKLHNYSVDNIDDVIINEYRKTLLYLLSGARNDRNRTDIVDLREDMFTYENGYNMAKTYFGKYYKRTIEENLIILENMLELLKYHKIKPIFIIAPTTKYYNSFFPSIHIRDIKEALDKLKKKYSFQFIDAFDREFEDCYFADLTHLNKKGASKFSEQLQQEIIW